MSAKLTAPLVARNMSAAEGAERARAGRIPQDVQQQAREKESPVVSELLLAARRGRSEQVADLLRQSPSQAAVVDKVCYFQYTVRVRVRGPSQYVLGLMMCLLLFPAWPHVPAPCVYRWPRHNRSGHPPVWSTANRLHD